jgi:hypothetical protein
VPTSLWGHPVGRVRDKATRSWLLKTLTTALGCMPNSPIGIEPTAPSSPLDRTVLHFSVTLVRIAAPGAGQFNSPCIASRLCSLRGTDRNKQPPRPGHPVPWIRSLAGPRKSSCPSTETAPRPLPQRPPVMAEKHTGRPRSTRSATRRRGSSSRFAVSVAVGCLGAGADSDQSMASSRKNPSMPT